ncbi:MAG: L-aspartate oxidase [Ktedonobacterales bacterium]
MAAEQATDHARQADHLAHADRSASTPASASADTSDTSDTTDMDVYDLVILGGGIAGLSVALNLPAAMTVALVTKATLGESNTRYAQGGLAAPVGLDDDPELQLRDTLGAGAGLVDEHATRSMLTEAREAVAWLVAQGTQFDERHSDHMTPSVDHSSSNDPLHELATRYDLTLEAAHSRRRVLHAHGDATGAEIERALVESARQRVGATIYERALAVNLIVQDGVCAGVEVWDGAQMRRLLGRRGVALANGGAGRLWLRTSNPAGATADGMALAWRAGAALADVEFAQFHPTVLVAPDEAQGGEPFLVSEAVRGEGAYLRNAAGERFMPRYHADAELAPRDVVARAILSEMLAEGVPCAWLDLRHLAADEVRARFPTISAACRRNGLDLARDLIPVAPAAHYFMGGVAVDTWARTTLPRLYAVGEVACTGVHGANRLASNSLLEGLVFGRRLARHLASDATDDLNVWPTQPVLPGAVTPTDATIIPAMQSGAPIASAARQAIQRTLWEYVSLRRTHDGLTSALHDVRAIAANDPDHPYDPETANMALVAQLVTQAALARTESRGAHYRSDYPDRDAARDGRHTLLQASLAEAVNAAKSEEARYVHA